MSARVLMGAIALTLPFGVAGQARQERPQEQRPESQARSERQVVRLPGGLEGLPFSAAIRVGDMLYLSGQIGILPGTRTLAPGGIEAETRQTMENIRTVLQHAGSSLERVVKCTVFLDDIANYDAMNRVYASFFPEDPPARSTLGADGLALGAAVEIECLALAGEGR